MQPPKLQNIPNMAVIGRQSIFKMRNVVFLKPFLILIGIIPFSIELNSSSFYDTLGRALRSSFDPWGRMKKAVGALEACPKPAEPALD